MAHKQQTHSDPDPTLCNSCDDMSATREVPAQADAVESKPISVRALDVSVETTKFSCENFLICDPRRWFHRYTVLLLICMLPFGFYYCYDSLTALQRTIIYVMQIDNTWFSILESVYSWPNVFIPVICGFLLDRLHGIRIGMIIFTFVICVGQLIVAFGGIYNNFPVMFVGRIIYGLIGDSLLVNQNILAIWWFRPTELSRVFGLLRSFSRIGSALSLNINQEMDVTMLGVAFLIGFALCILSLLCAIFLGILDKRAERILERKKSVRDTIDMKEFPLTFWLLVTICVTYYVTVFPYVGVATKFFMEKYGLTLSEANIVNSLVYIIPAATSPFIGYLIDKSGYNLIWLNSGIVITLIGHGILSFLPSATFIPYLAMTLVGIAFSVVACVLWPLVAFIIPDYHIGTAYGLVQAVQNLGLASVIILTSVIVEQCGYLILEVIFEGLLCVSLFAGICLYQFDSNSGGRLNASGHSRAKLQNGTVSSKNQRKTHPIHPELSSNNPSTSAAEPSNN